jgi:hypothetical protein
MGHNYIIELNFEYESDPQLPQICFIMTNNENHILLNKET